MSYWFTSDEHYGHTRILEYCKRPFADIHEMNKALTERHNEVVKANDTVIHCGDFTMNKTQYAKDIINRLNGKHIFITGSHDKWMKKFDIADINLDTTCEFPGYLLEQMINGTYVVACHYAMRVWPRSHYGSIQVYGHSHGNLPPIGRQMDVGVDSHNFYPISLTQVIQTINLNQGKTNDQASPSA